MRLPNFSIVLRPLASDPTAPLIIRDLGPWNQYPTVTNAAEDTIQWLAENGYLSKGRRVFYFDSEGDLDELIIEDGKFKDFGILGGNYNAEALLID